MNEIKARRWRAVPTRFDSGGGAVHHTPGQGQVIRRHAGVFWCCGAKNVFELKNVSSTMWRPCALTSTWWWKLLYETHSWLGARHRAQHYRARPDLPIDIRYFPACEYRARTDIFPALLTFNQQLLSSGWKKNNNFRLLYSAKNVAL